MPHPGRRPILAADNAQGVFARRVVMRLRQAGHVAYFAGGCVRDALLGFMPKDYDVATDATPERVREVFGHRRTLAIGAAFGVVSVQGHRTRGEGQVEVATFRSEGSYSDGRRPDAVRYSGAEEDAQRRDFTINGLFYDPVDDRVLDYVGGREDLHHGLIRAIGDPERRFGEDKLRLLRAVRFAATYSFLLEEATQAAVARHAAEIVQCSAERIGAEMRRLFASHGASAGMRLMRETGLLAPVMPDLDSRWNESAAAATTMSLPRGELALHLLDSRPQLGLVSALAALLSATADTAETAKAPLRDLADRWRLSGAEQSAITAALAGWQRVVQADRLPWSEVQPILAGRHGHDAWVLARTWATAVPLPEAGLHRAAERLAWPRERLDPPPLIDGQTLRQLGLPPGPGYRRWLAAARAAQLDGQIHSPDEALDFVQRLIAKERE